jgi:hypothetical protein
MKLEWFDFDVIATRRTKNQYNQHLHKHRDICRVDSKPLH